MAPFAARPAPAAVLPRIAPPPRAPPPRAVPWSLRARLWFGGFGSFGWLWLAFSIAFTAPFLRATDVSRFTTFRGELVREQGLTSSCTGTGYSVGGSEGQNGTPVHANHYRFESNGAEYHGVSYATGRCLLAGTDVTVEFPAGHPERSRIAGMRTRPLDATGLLVLIFPAFGILSVVVAFFVGQRRTGLLSRGRLALGTLLGKEPTRTKINGRTVMKLRFALETDRGTRHEIVVKTTEPEVLEDDPKERIFYDPDRPSRAVAWDSLPGSPALDAAGELMPAPAWPALRVLIGPALTGAALLGALLW
ncbi:MAG: hypothetical protein QM704_22950 [Anaeromyxobacteraceae bacterium]